MICQSIRRFVVGIDRAKMRLYDCEQSAQKDILDSGQEEEYNNEDKPKKSEDLNFERLLLCIQS